MTLRSITLLLTIMQALFIIHNRAHPADMSDHAKYTIEMDVNQHTANDAQSNNNETNQIFNIPPGIFTTYTQLPADLNHVDEVDDYVPYRSDVHDHFAWALIKQILVPTTATAEQHNHIQNDAIDGFYGAETENIIFSPFSIKLVLALLTEATGNGTCAQRQLLSTLGDIKSVENLRSFYRKTLASLKKEHPQYTLLLETRLYTDATVQTLSTYRALLHSAYDTPVEQLNFAQSADAAAQINSWTARATAGRLQQLVSEESVANSVMLLVNAIYFNGLWRRQFGLPYQSIFFRTAHIQLSATFMELTDIFYHYHCNDLSARIIRLPYLGEKFSMFIVLPNESQSVDALLKRMQNAQLKHMQWMMEPTELRVVLPKFKFDHKTDVKAALCRLGVVDIFTDKAELTGMVEQKDSRLLVSNILQKSGIDVNELGTEAYAATEVEIANRFGVSVDEFVVNRPFFFFIEEESTGNILFAGKVKNPTM